MTRWSFSGASYAFDQAEQAHEAKGRQRQGAGLGDDFGIVQDLALAAGAAGGEIPLWPEITRGADAIEFLVDTIDGEVAWIIERALPRDARGAHDDIRRIDDGAIQRPETDVIEDIEG